MVSSSAAPLAAVLAVALLQATAVAQEPRPLPFAGVLPDPGALSSWRIAGDAGGAGAPRRSRAIVLGNGRVRATLGLAEHAATLQAIVGPDHGAPRGPEGTFGEQRFVVRANGVEQRLRRHAIERVRGTDFVRTEDRGDDGLALVTLSFATGEMLYRLIAVHNDGKSTFENVQIVAEMPAALVEDHSSLRVGSGGADAPAATCRFLGEAMRDGRRLTHDRGRLAPGEVAEAVFQLRTYRSGNTLVWVDPEPWMIGAVAERALAAWRQRTADTVQIAGDDARLVDWLEDGKARLLAQRCAASGVFTAPGRDGDAPLAEQVGPLLALLRYGLFAEARQLLETIARATAERGELPPALPAGERWPPPAAAPVPFACCTMPADGSASLVVLMHHWHWRASGDTHFVRAHLPLLERCVDGQGAAVDTLQQLPASSPWHAGAWRDVLGARADTAGLLPAFTGERERPLSLVASVQRVLAIGALGDLRAACERLDRRERGADAGALDGADAAAAARARAVARMIETAAATERHFWQEGTRRFASALLPGERTPLPMLIADANLALPWLGWTFASKGRSAAHLTSTLAAAWRHPTATRIGLTADSGIATGCTFGLLLHALADQHDPAWRAALDELLRAAAPGGDLARRYGEDGEALAPDDVDPHATGLAIDAVFFASTGVRGPSVAGWDRGDEARFAPRLPPGSTRLALRGLRRDGRRVDLQLEQVPAPAAEPGPDRLRFRIDFADVPAAARPLTCAIHVGAATLVRHVTADQPFVEATVALPVDAGAVLPARR